MSLKNVEMIRKNAVLASRFAVQRVRIFTSSIDGNHDAVNRIRGDGETDLVSRITEMILEHMGHTTEVTEANSDSRRRSQVRKVLERGG